jgi:hypothetical protein
VGEEVEVAEVEVAEVEVEEACRRRREGGC